MRFYIYLESDYELDADSIEEKNKVGIRLILKKLIYPIVTYFRGKMEWAYFNFQKIMRIAKIKSHENK